MMMNTQIWMRMRQAWTNDGNVPRATDSDQSNASEVYGNNNARKMGKLLA